MWVKKLFPRTIARFSTPYNRDIRVNYEAGKYKLLVNGSRQSGEYVRKLWQSAFCAFNIIPSPGVRSILVLGVAGGDVIHMLSAMFPQAAITGVDIDAKMIEIGKKYFGLGNLSGAALVVADAKDFMKKKRTWDIILCDTHIGASIPAFVSEDEFLRNVKNSLRPGGKAIVNYLYEYEYKVLSDAFEKKLQSYFSHVADYRIYFNRFFFVVK